MQGSALSAHVQHEFVAAFSQPASRLQAEVYKLYGKAYGWYSIIALFFFWASEQSTNILTSWWLSQWATAQILYQVEQGLGA